MVGVTGRFRNAIRVGRLPHGDRTRTGPFSTERPCLEYVDLFGVDRAFLLAPAWFAARRYYMAMEMAADQYAIASAHLPDPRMRHYC